MHVVLIFLTVVVAAAHALPKPVKVSADDLDKATNEAPKKTAASTALPSRRKRTAVAVPVQTSEGDMLLVGDDSEFADVGAQDETEMANAELDLLTNEDWYYVAQVVEQLAEARAEQRLAELQELDAELEAEEEAAAAEPVMIVDEPEFVLLDDGRPEVTVADDPDVVELEAELAAESELKDHIDELSQLIKMRYAVQ